MQKSVAALGLLVILTSFAHAEDLPFNLSYAKQALEIESQSELDSAFKNAQAKWQDVARDPDDFRLVRKWFAAHSEEFTTSPEARVFGAYLVLRLDRTKYFDLIRSAAKSEEISVPALIVATTQVVQGLLLWKVIEPEQKENYKAEVREELLKLRASISRESPFPWKDMDALDRSLSGAFSPYVSNSVEKALLDKNTRFFIAPEKSDDLRILVHNPSVEAKRISARRLREDRDSPAHEPGDTPVLLHAFTMTDDYQTRLDLAQTILSQHRRLRDDSDQSSELRPAFKLIEQKLARAAKKFRSSQDISQRNGAGLEFLMLAQAIAQSGYYLNEATVSGILGTSDFGESYRTVRATVKNTAGIQDVGSRYYTLGLLSLELDHYLALYLNYFRPEHKNIKGREQAVARVAKSLFSAFTLLKTEAYDRSVPEISDAALQIMSKLCERMNYEREAYTDVIFVRTPLFKRFFSVLVPLTEEVHAWRVNEDSSATASERAIVEYLADHLNGVPTRLQSRARDVVSSAAIGPFSKAVNEAITTQTLKNHDYHFILEIARVAIKDPSSKRRLEAVRLLGENFMRSLSDSRGRANPEVFDAVNRFMNIVVERDPSDDVQFLAAQYVVPDRLSDQDQMRMIDQLGLRAASWKGYRELSHFSYGLQRTLVNLLLDYAIRANPGPAAAAMEWIADLIAYRQLDERIESIDISTLTDYFRYHGGNPRLGWSEQKYNRMFGAIEQASKLTDNPDRKLILEAMLSAKAEMFGDFANPLREARAKICGNRLTQAAGSN